jgi:pilus assembly protein CpaB
MDAKKIALLVGALLFAGLTAFMAKNMFAGASAPAANAAAMPAKPNGPQILVATRALQVGTIVGPDSYRYQPWPKELVEGAYFLKGKFEVDSLNGTVVRSPVTAGQPLTQGALVKPGDRGFLAAALGPGMRAVTIKTTSQSGVAGFIFPGDRVDLILTQEIEGKGSADDLAVSETILRNVRVLATDQRTVSTDEKGEQIVKVFTSVTLEVTPRIAEKVVVAQSMGKLTLSLRSIADNAADLERAIASGEVTVPNGTDSKSEKAMISAGSARPLDTGGSYQTGGDVSRFRSRTPSVDYHKPVSQRAEEIGQSFARGMVKGGAPSAYGGDPFGGRPASRPRSPSQGQSAPAPQEKAPVVFIWRAGKKQEVELGGN